MFEQHELFFFWSNEHLLVNIKYISNRLNLKLYTYYRKAIYKTMNLGTFLSYFTQWNRDQEYGVKKDFHRCRYAIQITKEEVLEMSYVDQLAAYIYAGHGNELGAICI